MNRPLNNEMSYFICSILEPCHVQAIHESSFQSLSSSIFRPQIIDDFLNGAAVFVFLNFFLVIFLKMGFSFNILHVIPLELISENLELILHDLVANGQGSVDRLGRCIKDNAI